MVSNMSADAVKEKALSDYRKKLLEHKEVGTFLVGSLSVLDPDS